MLNWQPNRQQNLILGLSLIVSGLTSSVEALEVEIKPARPQLGDTISVVVKLEEPNSRPKVTMRGTSYPFFPTNNGNNRYRALLPTSPLDRSGSIPIQVSGDGETRNLAVFLKSRSFPTQRITLKGGGSNATQTELDQVAAFKALVTPKKFWNGVFVRPNSARVSAVYGVRRYYNGVFAHDYYHRGVDYAGGYGSPIVAPAAGQIRLIGRESKGFRVHGNTVGIDHGQGVVSIFLHLSQINVQEGDFVKAGQKIGTVGSTGSSTGPHLHWGLYVHGVAVDPVPWRFKGLE